MSGDTERGTVSPPGGDLAALQVAARIFLETPNGREALAATPIVVGETPVRRVAERLAEGSPALLARLRHAVARYEARPTWLSREQVVEAVTSVALSLVLGNDTNGHQTLMEGEIG